jgi:peptidyl-prolyl cis-trans isomerase B (cyclophilin B)
MILRGGRFAPGLLDSAARDSSTPPGMIMERQGMISLDMSWARRLSGPARWTKWLVLLAAASAGCGGEAEPTAASNGDSPATAGSTAGTATKQVDVQHPIVRIETNFGQIAIKLNAEKAPGTVQNFLNYVNDGFYKNTLFHYVVPGKMILGGGYTAEHELKRTRPEIRNEAHSGLKNLRGTIAMARSGDVIDSANSQFFINLVDAPERDYKGDTPEEYGYCVFGEVVAGLDVAEKISRSSTANLSHVAPDMAQTPQPPLVITSIRVER